MHISGYFVTTKRLSDIFSWGARHTGALHNSGVNRFVCLFVCSCVRLSQRQPPKIRFLSVKNSLREIHGCGGGLLETSTKRATLVKYHFVILAAIDKFSHAR